jgi:GMP synthase (glutamine-hydrolysing)
MEADVEADEVAVVDFGSQYSQLIIRRIRELGYFAKLYLPSNFDEIENPLAIVLSGGPQSIEDPESPSVNLERLQSHDVPVLGICYGMQMLTHQGGGTVEQSETREYGPADILVHQENTLFDDLPENLQVWMSHSDTVTELPGQSEVLARNRADVPAAIQFDESTYGIQFHPEVSHTDRGTDILDNFLLLTETDSSFTMESYKDKAIREIRETVGDREVFCAVSGGVDSTVVSVLLDEAGVDLRPVFIDSGLLRKNEVEEVQEQFRELGIEIETVDASDRFLDNIEGVEDPEEKRNIIGETFLDVFFDTAGEIEMLAQGTLYPDVIESATSESDADTIKTHHNRVNPVLQLKQEGRVIEPLDELFKDEVRELGELLGIPHATLHRHPFPGPGLAIRIPGVVTDDRLERLREADDIFIKTLKEWGWYDKVWQAFCVLLPVKTVGVKGDRRSYENAVSVRSVISKDGMTADWSKLPDELLEEVSNKILNEVDGISRVLYDISTKPPSSIEWE